MRLWTVPADAHETDIRLIAEYFEAVFNVDLGNFYHTYLEIKNRKINRTKFLDTLRDAKAIKKPYKKNEKRSNRSYIFFIFAIDLQGNWTKMNAVSTITKSLPTTIAHLVNYSL